MKLPIDIKRVKLYLRIGVTMLSVNLFSDLVNNVATFDKRAINNLWLTIYLIVINFSFFEYAFPFIKSNWKKVLIPLFLVWVYFILFSYGLYTWRYIGIKVHIYSSLKIFSSTAHAVFYLFPYGFGSLFFFAVGRHIYNYIKLKQATQQLRIEKQEAELNYLRSQTNPHFLFNTLNNIYSLARDKSDVAPESILRLSKILRFMLYETSGDYISIEQELKIIDDYIALEKLRYDNSLRIICKNDIEDMKQAIPPLLLIPLVENAFKHGVSETRDEPFVDIYLSVKQQQLAFIVKNSSEEFAEQSIKESIGLSNLRRQLELLYKDYDLSVKQSGSVFTATLKINLASHV